jgi:2-polyprenyl-3-methyl-5-hydroxy-6-metoxy-1,4-benzoquinol methylase
MKPDLRVRAADAEMMDDPDVNPAALDHAMAHLEFINRSLNGYGPSLRGLAQLLPEPGRSFSLLDVGCGSGDTLRQIAKWARRRGYRAQLTGIELSERSAQRAAEKCLDYPEITIHHGDFMEARGAIAPFDIVHCALVLHHFSEDAAASGLLREMARAASTGIIVNDLHRHPLAYHSIRLLTRAFSGSPILRNDAPLSVARAFTRQELAQIAAAADLTGVDIQWHWAFRWLLTAHGKADNANP